MPDVFALAAFLEQRRGADGTGVRLVRVGTGSGRHLKFFEAGAGPEPVFQRAAPDGMVAHRTMKMFIRLAILLEQPVKPGRGHRPQQMHQDAHDLVGQALCLVGAELIGGLSGSLQRRTDLVRIERGALAIAPGCRATSRPPLNTISVGMLRMP